MRRWALALALALLGCNSNAPSPLPSPTPTPWPEVTFGQPRVAFDPSTITVGFGSVLLPPDKIIEGSFLVDLGQPRHITRIWSFVGVDAGDLGEFAIDLSAGGRIYQRSLHKESIGIYDAWAVEEVDVTTQFVRVHTLGHMVAKQGHLELELILEFEN